jgi:3-isopropylmalate/(R)-2-methylmalate dehydratase large subunit
MDAMARNAREFGIRLFPMGAPEQGIVHVIAPQLGLTEPGMTIVCGDSHTSTHGAFGAIAFGIGTSEVEHVLATQTLWADRPGTMAVTVEGALPTGVWAKDVILGIIARIGVRGGVGAIIEYRGSAIRALSMEGRMTICNMSIEAGARAGMVAPDETTYAYVEKRQHAPKGVAWERALDDWRALPTDDGARFDREVRINASELRPYVSWGTNPSQTVTVDGHVSGSRCARPDAARGRGSRAPLHGPPSRYGDARHRCRCCFSRLVHQRAHRRPAGGRRCRPGPQSALGRSRARGAGLDGREGAGGA